MQLVFERCLKIRMVDTADSIGKGKEKAPPPSKPSSGTATPAAKPKPTMSGMAGKINTIVGADMANILRGREFLFIGVLFPVEISAGIFFLYRLVGWAAFVGLAVQLALLPLPGYLAGMMNKYQKQKMQKVCRSPLPKHARLIESDLDHTTRQRNDRSCVSLTFTKR